MRWGEGGGVARCLLIAVLVYGQWLSRSGRTCGWCLGLPVVFRLRCWCRGRVQGLTAGWVGQCWDRVVYFCSLLALLPLCLFGAVAFLLCLVVGAVAVSLFFGAVAFLLCPVALLPVFVRRCCLGVVACRCRLFVVAVDLL